MRLATIQHTHCSDLRCEVTLMSFSCSEESPMYHEWEQIGWLQSPIDPRRLKIVAMSVAALRLLTSSARSRARFHRGLLKRMWECGSVSRHGATRMFSSCEFLYFISKPCMGTLHGPNESENTPSNMYSAFVDIWSS